MPPMVLQLRTDYAWLYTDHVTLLAPHSRRRFQAELFLNSPCQISYLSTESRQDIIHCDDSEKVSMFINYRETANAPVTHKPHSIEHIVIDVDHRWVSGHDLFYRSLPRLFLAGNNLKYDIPVREDSYRPEVVDYYHASNVLGCASASLPQARLHPVKS